MEDISFSTLSGTHSQGTYNTFKSPISLSSPDTHDLQFDSRPASPKTPLRPDPALPEPSYSLAPASPTSPIHVHLPGVNATAYNRLATLLLNHLQGPILPKKQILKERLFKQTEQDREIYHTDIHPSSEEAARVGLSSIKVMGLDHYETDLLTNKYQQGEFMVYAIEVKICMCDRDNNLLIIEAGKGNKEVGMFKSFFGDKEELVGACVRGEMRVPIYISLRPWDNLHWITAIKWLRLLSKAQFDSYGEARKEREVKEVKKKLPEVAILRDQDLLLEVLLPMGKPDFASYI